MKFSQFYLSPQEFVTDSQKMRVRTGNYIHSISFESHSGNYALAQHIAINIGVEVPGYYSVSNQYFYDFKKFILEIDVVNLLDCLTAIFNFLKIDFKAKWKNFVNECFTEEGIAYIMNDNGGLRFRPDEEFEKNRILTLKDLSASEYAAVITAFNAAYNDFQTDINKSKSALRYMFEANEILFKKLAKPKFSFDQLNRTNLVKMKDYVLGAMNQSDSTAKLAGNKFFESYMDWVDAIHPYRHGQDVASYNNPPIDITILALSNGASYLRWFASMAKAKK